MSRENQTQPGGGAIAPDETGSPVARGWGGPTDNRGTSAKGNPKTVPYDRFQEVVSERNALKTRLESLSETEAERIRKDLDDKQSLEALYQQEKASREAAEERARRWDEYQAQRREALLSKLTTAEDREDLSDLDLEKLERQVERRLGQPFVGMGNNPARPGRKPGREKPLPLSQLTAAERRASHQARLAAYQK